MRLYLLKHFDQSKEAPSSPPTVSPFHFSTSIAYFISKPLQNSKRSPQREYVKKIPTSIPPHPSTHSRTSNMKRFARSSVLESQRPAVVWLYAGEYCDQCEEVAAMIEGAAPKLASWGLSVVAVDLSTETKLAKELGAPRSAAMMFKVR